MSKKQDIILEEHQIIPSSYLNKCNKLHGILLWYSVGTGKTLTALTIALNNPNKDIIVVSPEELTFVWENETKKIGNFKNKISFKNYKNLKDVLSSSKLSNTIIILDEIQNLVNSFKDPTSYEYKNISFFLSKLKTCNKVICLTATPVYTEIVDLVYIINIASGKEVLPYNYSEFKRKFYNINKIKSIFFGYIKSINETISKLIQYSMFIGGSLGFVVYKTVKPTTLLSFYEKHQNSKFFKNIKNVIPLLGNLMLVSSVITILSETLDVFDKTYDSYLYFNTQKFVDEVSPYTIYYTNDASTNKYYPDIDEYTETVSYTNYQMEIWLKLTQSVLDIDTIKKLNISSNPEFYNKILDKETYVNKGVMIGNLKDEKNGIYPNKFHEIIKKAKNKRAVCYTQFIDTVKVFKEFLDKNKIKYVYLDNKSSNLEKTKILQRFKDETFLLVLHPDYHTGISILGAQQLHIMEPISLNSKTQQLIGRVVRYKSHHHLPEDQRYVEVYQWVCENSGLLANLKKNIMSINSWYKYSPAVFYTNKTFMTFSQDITPDSVIFREQSNINDITNKITNSLQSRKHKKTCCIKYPSSVQERECLKELPTCSRTSSKQSKTSSKQSKTKSSSKSKSSRRSK